MISGLRASAVAALGFGVATCFGCADRAQRPPGFVPRVPLVAEAALAAAYASPARFVYHPRERARPRAFRRLADGDQLLVGERGERWQYSPKNRWLRPGAILAPEPLIAVLGDTSAFSFIGASGTAYVARDALGPFERSSAPVEALTSVSAAGSSIIGVRQTRSLLRSGDFGVSWQNVGPRAEAVVSVGIESTGLGYALVTPEAVYETSDFGATWQKLDAPSVGAVELVTAFDGQVRALTPLGERAYNRAEKRWRSALPVAPPSSGWPAPPRGPDAAALADGRAVIVNGSYFELVAGSERGAFDSVSGALGGPYQRKPFSAAKSCRAVRVAAFEQWLVFACFHEVAESLSQPIELYRGSVSGDHFERVPGRLDGALAAFRLSVGASGRWIASGVCPPGVAGSGCAPSGIQRERDPDENPSNADEPSKKRVGNAAGTLSAAPSLSSVAMGLAFSTDGRSAYAVGRRSKTGRFALFVSRDGGKTFAPRDLDLGQVASDESDDDMVERSPGTRVDSLSAAEDGAVAIAFSHYGRRTLVVTDDQGKLLSASEPPEERALIGASGLRAIAIAHKSRQVWESLDGGVTFEPAGTLPLELCPNEDQCDVPVRCAPSGCVIGKELTRVGWGGLSADEAVVLPPPLRPLRPLAERRVSTPISCTLDSGRFIPLPGVADPPRAHDSQIGKAAWFVVADDPAHAAATLYVARKGRVEPLSLFDPAPRPDQRAYAVLSQVEGVAAVRYRLPEAQPGKSSLTDVEVVAQNFIEGQLVRARLADGGPYSPGDYTSNGSHTPQAQPDLVSIASGGVYLRLHQSARTDQPTLFLDGRHVETIPAVEWPRDSRFPSRAEMVRVGTANVPILFVGRGAAIARARRSGSGAAWQFDAFATGMVDPASFGLVSFDNIAYVGNRAGLYLETQDGTGTVASAQIFPFRADGALVDSPVNVPTQLGLGEHPTACDAEHKAHSPRIVAAYQPGTRHPIVVNDNVEGPRTLLTAFAVLHGTPEAPCVAAYEAVGIAPESGQATRETALILMDDLEHSVLFRRAPGEAGQVSYRHMSCRFDPAVEVPPEVYRALP